MIFIRAFLLWAVISVHVIGAAFLFRRFFPRDSRWLAFVLPALIFVLFCNFLEHAIPIVSLRFLLPFTTVASIVLIAAPGGSWRVMRLPTLLFVSSFAFNLFLRAMLPNITDSRDGVADLGLISDFLFGQTLPPESTWLPPVKLVHYYYLEHYAASVLIRFLGVDPGTGFNLSAALLSTYIYFFAGAGGWLLSRGRLWIAVLMPMLTACAATGTTGYLWLTVKNLSQENIINLHSALGNPGAATNWILGNLTPINNSREPVLMPPGFGGWSGSFHSVQAGQFVIGLAVLSLIEVLRRRRSNWPWISLLLSPFLMLTTCTWNVPVIGGLILVGFVVAHQQKLRPASYVFVLGVAGGLIAFLEPMLVNLLNWEPVAGFGWVEERDHTPLPEFLGQWWLVLLPWIALPFAWRRLSSITRIFLFFAPAIFIMEEFWNIGWRGDMTAKCWSCLYAASWMVFIPEIARQRAWPFRIILALVVAACLLSLCFWTTFDWRAMDADSFGRLDGRGAFRTDGCKARIVASLARLDGAVIIAGQVDGDGAAALMMPLSHTRAYAAWDLTTDMIFYTNGLYEAGRRRVMVAALYSGNLADPLTFLRQANISAVVIYPEDNIKPEVLQQLKQKLEPYYSYEDAWDRSDKEMQTDQSPGSPCAGVFVYHPEIAKWLGAPKETAAK